MDRDSASARQFARAMAAMSIAGAIDLALRLVARRGFPRLLGFASDPDPAFVLAATLAAAACGLAAARRARQSAAALVITAAIAAGLFAQAKLGARLQSDGFYYFAYLRSLAFDRDVDLANDYRLLGLDDAQHRHLFTPTATGHAQSAWSIGPALVWSPFFAGGHAVASHLSRQGEGIDTNGTSYPYRQAVAAAGLVYGVLGLWFTYRFVLLFFPRRDALPSVVLTALGSFILWYLVREPTMSHAPSMAAVAAFLWTWGAGRERRAATGWLALGIVGGLMMDVRWQNVIVFLLPALDLLARIRRTPRAAIASGAALGAGAVAGFLPQMLAWRAIYGHLLATSPVGPSMHWLHPQIPDLLWSSRNGLFAWSPVLVAGVLGLFALTRRHPRVAWGSLAVFAIAAWVNGAVDDWWGGAGFGMRRFDSLLPLLALGTAASVAYITTLLRERPQLAVGGALAAMVLWNVSLMAVAAGGAYRIGEAISFGDVGARQVRVLHRWFGHPFSYPANLAYAASNRVAPWRYDLLRPYRFLADPGRPYGRVDVGSADAPYVLDGWHDAEHDGAVTFRWADRTAMLLVPLAYPAALLVQVQAHAFSFPGAPPQRVTISINGARLDPIVLGADWQRVEATAPASMWHSGVNRVLLDFEWAARPADVGAGGDRRSLAAAVDYVRIAIR
ncbi:MAG: hypothetical protein A3H96_17135 [Acidobacteria bacterium RIFCSPLOWO2_02_FULL_67_36]|nr:MAG: hypothetical protein A3H96_17135 [Acidobacteria bacterium RIFCSPLOWO2_02_FULL_67_36]